MDYLKSFLRTNRQNQDGYAIGSCLLVLMIITIVSVMALRTSNSDNDISTNHHVFGRAFYAAEAGRAFVRYHPQLYGSGRITPNTPVNFPDAGSPTITAPVISGGIEAFRGTVEYLNSSVVPRGSGFQAGKFRAHNYRMICEGLGPRDSITRIEAGFYRIGF
jgi:hypothetical protein